MYPKLVAKVFYETQQLFDYFDVSNENYEFKAYIQTDDVTLIEIPWDDTDFVFRSKTYNVLYKVESSKRYFYPQSTGTFECELQYFYNDTYYTLEKSYIVYRKNTFPKMVLTPFLDDEEYPKFLDINNEYTIKTYLMFEDGTKIETPQLTTTVIAADRNINIVAEGGEFVLYLLEVGTCKVNMYFDYCGSTIFSSDDLLVYSPFFRDNYMSSLITQFDVSNLQSNKKQKVMFDTLMEFMDILYAYNQDIKLMNNIGEIKSRFLGVAGISRGFEKSNIYEGQTLEWVYEKMYRELLNNLLDLLQLRGTKLAYELFFGALGYDIDILEFWFDANGKLIEINYEDELLSTFYAYDTEGNPLEDIQVPHIDPRKDISVDNEYNYVSKSKYIKAIISQKEGIYNPLAFSIEQQYLIETYLAFLCPQHLEYLQNVFKINVSQTETEEGEYLYELEDGLSNFMTADLVELLGYYIDMSGIYSALSPLTYWPLDSVEHVGHPYWIPPAGLMQNIEHDYKGAFYYKPLNYSDADPYRNVRGMCIEHLRMPQESVVIGDGLEWSELLDIPVVYDAIYDYDEVEPDSVGLQYDVGRLLYDSELEVIDINVFDQQYDDYITTHTLDETIEYLMGYFGITEQRCQNIIAIL